MGCDIHLHIEVKLEGQWFHLGNPSPCRNYWCFTKLAGVRNVKGVIPIVLPRGLPEDISTVTRVLAKRWEDDGHSWSWIDADEIAEFCDWYRSMDIPRPNECVEGWLGMYLDNNGFGYIPAWLEDLRFVFWFDN